MMMVNETPCTRLAAALHAACVALDEARQEKRGAATLADQALALESAGADGAPPWTDAVGRHVALAVAALPESILRAWLLDHRVVGGEQIYKTLRVGAATRAAGGSKEAA
jgi:hypothetical protein